MTTCQCTQSSKKCPERHSFSSCASWDGTGLEVVTNSVRNGHLKNVLRPGMQLSWWNVCLACTSFYFSFFGGEGGLFVSLSMVEYTCNPSIWEMEEGESEVQGYL